MSSPFDLPRADCPYNPTVEEISDCPMTPKPLWTGAVNYCDPNFPSGAGPDDVPPAPPPFGEATPPTISPPTQTSIGGGGGGGGTCRDYELYCFENGGAVTVYEGDLLKPSGCEGWSPGTGCYLLELNDVNSNLLLFVCVTSSVDPGNLGYCYCLSGRVYQKTFYDGAPMPQVYESMGSNDAGELTRHLVGFRVVAVNNPEVHYVKDIMPSQAIKITESSPGSVVGQTIVDTTGTLGGEDIPGVKLTAL